MLIMPSPARAVRSSVAICRRMGMTREQALITVIDCCGSVLSHQDPGQARFNYWVAEIRQEAAYLLFGPKPPTIQDWTA